MLSDDAQTNPMLRLFDCVEIRNESEVREGDFCYISSAEEYLLKHPLGHASGLNAMCVDDKNEPRYLALGLPPQGENRVDIERGLLDEYNQPPEGQEMVSPHLWEWVTAKILNNADPQPLIDEMRDRTYTWEQFQEMAPRASQEDRMEGKLSLMVLRPNLEKIQALVASSIYQVRDVFVRLTKSDLDDVKNDG